MAVVLTPPPIGQPMFDTRGRMTQVWQQFFIDVQTAIIGLNGSAGPLPLQFSVTPPLPAFFQTGVGHTVDDLVGVLQTEGLLRQS